MRQSLVTRALVCLTLLLLSAQAAYACSCIDSGPPCQAYGAVSAVFSGRVMEITSFSSTDGPLKDYSQRLVRFAVLQPYRGVSGNSAETVTGNGGGDCGYPFKVGESYLVYAYQNSQDNRLYASICSRTRPLSEAGEDLEYIHSLSNATGGGTIYGVVNRFRRVNADVSYQPLGPMGGVRVAVEGGGRSVEALTDGEGAFRVLGLSPGSYNVRLAAPEGFWPGRSEHKVELRDKGCAVVNFTLERNTSLSGRVLNEGGGPAAKIMVNLVLSNQVNERYQRNILFVQADAEGRFEFRSIPPGEYLLGVRLSRVTDPQFAYPRTFYPDTQELALAQVIVISEGQSLEGYTIQLPQRLTPRKIGGVIVWPDGKPVPDARICFEEVEYAEGSACHAGDAKVGEDGRFSFTGFEGLRYLLRAHVNVGGAGSGQRHAEPVEAPAKGSINDIKLVVTEPNGTCAKCLRWTRSRGQ